MDGPDALGVAKYQAIGGTQFGLILPVMKVLKIENSQTSQCHMSSINLSRVLPCRYFSYKLLARVSPLFEFFKVKFTQICWTSRSFSEQPSGQKNETDDEDIDRLVTVAFATCGMVYGMKNTTNDRIYFIQIRSRQAAQTDLIIRQNIGKNREIDQLLCTCMVDRKN